MKLPLSWLKEYVDIDLSLEQLARALTMTGLEVEEITLVGLPMPTDDHLEFKYSGLTWEREKFVVAQINEVMPHPNADRLVLCKLDDGNGELIILTGAPNLYPYKGTGTLAKPIKVAYAREGAKLYDGHQPGQVLTTLKRTKIRGVESFSMVCSEKELGISDEHEGIILLDDDAPTGVPLLDYMGDAVLEISILPNMIRNSCVSGVAREVAAFTGKALKIPQHSIAPTGESIEGKVQINISDPALNPRFMVGLIRDVKPVPSPYWVQRRLRLAGMRPINSIVDATNYVMMELGEPLHAFDYDTLVRRANGKAPTIITRPAEEGEKLTTLDGVERTLSSFTIMVADTAGSLSLAGVMGGMESEVTENTRNVLLEGASWNFVNIRRTVTAQKLPSEAAYRFSRGVHPALAKEGLLLGLQRMAAWGGGAIAQGIVDSYPQPYVDPQITLSADSVKRLLGIDLTSTQIAALLERLEFRCEVKGDSVVVQSPSHRTDIGEGVVGEADLMEEIARLYGYDNFPVTGLRGEIPPAFNDRTIQLEDKIRDYLVEFGLQEIITYRFTSPEREARILPAGSKPENQDYVRLQNPISPDRVVMRRNQMAAMLEVMEKNTRLSQRMALFEVGQVFLPQPDQQLPAEPTVLSIAITGLRQEPAWDQPASQNMDFFDLKGIIETLLTRLHVQGVVYQPVERMPYHPGKCALIMKDDQNLGIFGELHPLVKQNYDFGAAPVLAAELQLAAVMQQIPERHETGTVPTHPPVLEDLAVIVDEEIPAVKVAEVITQGGGNLLRDVRLFDVFRGEQIGEGKKSLAYSLTYQAADRTLTDKDAAQIRQRIIRRIEHDLNAKIRS
jgi:phenylalanyl-tRNA synthetase beta chain